MISIAFVWRNVFLLNMYVVSRDQTAQKRNFLFVGNA